VSPRDTLNAALAALLARAKVREADGPLTARNKLLRLLDAEGCVGPAHDPEGCPVATWLRRATGLRILVTPTRAVVTGGWVLGKAERWVVDLPAPLAAALERVDGRKVPWLTGDAA
jgi:hypothetical protein